MSEISRCTAPSEFAHRAHGACVGGMWMVGVGMARVASYRLAITASGIGHGAQSLLIETASGAVT